jgi:hypothetical protein
MADAVVRNGMVYEITVEGKEKLVGALDQLMNKQKSVQEAVAKSTVATKQNTVATNAQATAYKHAGAGASVFTRQLRTFAAQAVSIYAIAKAFKFITNAVMEQEEATATLNASLKNTGVYSAQFSKALQDNASALQKVTTYGDEAILTGTALMQNIGKLGEDVLPQAQKAAIGLAATYNKSLPEAFTMLGRAAAGNTTLFTRWGIVLDDGMSAQEKFNKVLEIGTKGFALAEAQAATLAGRMAQVKNMIGDAAEVIGDALIPSVKSILESVIPIINSVVTALTPIFTELAGIVQITAKEFIAFAKAIGPALLTTLGAVVKAVGAVVEWFGKLHAMTKVMIIAVPLLIKAWMLLQASGIALAYTLGGVTGVLGYLSTAFGTAALAVKGFLASIGPVGWAIMGVGAALATLGVILNRTKKEAEQAAAATAKIRQSMDEVRGGADGEVAVFRVLIGKLQEMKKNTDQVVQSKQGMKTLIHEINSKYGTYLGNLDLERASYDQIAAAANKAANAIMQKKLAEGFSALADEAAKRVGVLRLQWEKLKPELRKLQTEEKRLRDILGPKKTLANLFKSEAAGFALIDVSGRIKEILKVKNDLRNALTELAGYSKAYAEELAKLDLEFPAPAPTPGAASDAMTKVIDAVTDVDKAFTDADKAFTDFWDNVNKYSASSASDPLQPLINDLTEYLNLLSQSQDISLGLTAPEIGLATTMLNRGYINRITAAATKLQDELTEIADSGERDRVAIIQREAQKQRDALEATRNQVQFMMEAMATIWGPATPNVPAYQALLKVLGQLDTALNVLTANEGLDIAAANADKAAAALEKLLGYSQLVTDNAVELGITQAEYTAQRTTQIEEEIKGLKAIYNTKEQIVMLDELQKQRLAKIPLEWLDLWADKLRQILDYSKLLTDNALGLNLTYEQFYAERELQITKEIEGLQKIYGMTDALAKLQELRLGNIAKEWEQLQIDQWIDQNSELYDGINKAVAAMVDGFGKMITEGKSFEETMANIWKSWVAIAIDEVQKLITKLIVAAIIKSVVAGATGGASLVTGFASGGYVGEGLAIPEVGGFAAGGLVMGAGSGLDDRNLVAVSNGEYIVNASATRQNRQLLDTINSGAAPVDDTLINELRMLRRDLRSGLTAPVKMHWRKGEMARAVGDDAKHRHVI